MKYFRNRDLREKLNNFLSLLKSGNIFSRFFLIIILLGLPLNRCRSIGAFAPIKSIPYSWDKVKAYGTHIFLLAEELDFVHFSH